MPIQSIFCSPALSIARFGASSAPMDAFTWVPSEDPHNEGETRIAPDWTLDVQADGTVVPRMPKQIVLRDVGDIRPVAPFIEIWCDDAPDGQPANRIPLTASKLVSEGLALENLTFTIEAMNFKAARRTGNPDLRFGTFPSVQVLGDQHAAQRLDAVSPPSARVRMIPRGQSINLGKVQVIRPTPQPAAGTTPWDADVNVDVIRIRFTPPRGDVFGPVSIKGTGVTAHGAFYPRVPTANAFLADDAGWLGAQATRAPIEPSDTFDGAEQRSALSFGIVDDTCELRISVTLDRTAVGQDTLETHANIFSAPPDFAPDRRPFQSLADSLNDRVTPATIEQRNQELTPESLDRWVEDLFERAFETVSLLNVDLWRNTRAATLTSGQQGPPIGGDQYPEPTRAMGGRDALRDPNIAIQAPSPNVPLPLYKRARDRHRTLADILALKNFVLQDPNRLAALLRAPFTEASNESSEATTMQMPPFMRGANAEPLTLMRWQYDLLMSWQARVAASSAAPMLVANRFEAARAVRSGQRRAAVLARLDAARKS